MKTLRSVADVVREYQRQGYAVSLRPNPQTMPELLRNFDVDLIATRGDEVVLVEVKNRATAEAENLAALANAIDQLPGWRLDLILLPSSMESTSPNKVLDHESMRARLRDAERLADAGSYESAMLLAWTAIEAQLRSIAANNDVPIRAYGPAQIAKQLVTYGLLDERQYRDLISLVGVRNNVVHGFRREELSRDDARKAVRLATELAPARSD